MTRQEDAGQVHDALAAAWLRVSREEAFIGRTGGVGDDLGSALATARVARDLVRIGFLVERRWAPYSKWLGTAFSRQPIAEQVGPHLSAAVHADGWREREAALCAARRELAVAANRLGLAAAPPVRGWRPDRKAAPTVFHAPRASAHRGWLSGGEGPVGGRWSGISRAVGTSGYMTVAISSCWA